MCEDCEVSSACFWVISRDEQWALGLYGRVDSGIVFFVTHSAQIYSVLRVRLKVYSLIFGFSQNSYNIKEVPFKLSPARLWQVVVQSVWVDAWRRETESWVGCSQALSTHPHGVLREFLWASLV